jgi:PAS domain S-box-containing protein
MTTHVLIAEDQAENRDLLKLLLEVNGYRVTAVGDGMEALAAARQEAPDVIVSDALMPRMDGFALCRAWMQDSKLRAIPFIFYSATYVRPDDEQFAHALGAVRYLIKPLEAAVFLRELRAVLQQWAGRTAPGPVAPLDEISAHTLHESALARKVDDKIAQLEAAQRRLRESEEKFRRISECVQDVYIETRLDGTILEMSPQIATLSKGQYRSEDLIGTSVNALYADAEYSNSVLNAIKQNGFAIDIDATFRNRDGSLIPCSVSTMIVRGTNGDLRSVATLRDISRRKQAERALIDSELRFRGLVEESPIGMFLSDGKRLLYANPRVEEMLGYARGELAGASLAPLIAEADQPSVQQMIANIVSGEPSATTLEFSARRRDGSELRLSGQGRRAQLDRLPAVVGVLQDESAEGRPASGQQLAPIDSSTH